VGLKATIRNDGVEGIINTAAINMPQLDNWGTQAFPHYDYRRDWAGDPPFQWTKQRFALRWHTNGVAIHGQRH